MDSTEGVEQPSKKTFKGYFRPANPFLKEGRTRAKKEFAKEEESREPTEKSCKGFPDAISTSACQQNTLLIRARIALKKKGKDDRGRWGKRPSKKRSCQGRRTVRKSHFRDRPGDKKRKIGVVFTSLNHGKNRKQTKEEVGDRGLEKIKGVMICLESFVRGRASSKKFS